MNRAYRIIWCSIRQMKVVVAENSRARGKGAASGRAGKRALLLCAGTAAFLALSLAPGRLWAAGAVCVDAETGNAAGLGQSADTGRIACGQNASATGASATAIGSNASKAGVQGIAIGIRSNASAVNSIAIGTLAKAQARDSIALGRDAQATANSGDVALGANSSTAVVVATPSTTINGVTYEYAGINPTSTVSIGRPGAERTITNVAAGRVSDSSTDAINGSQLYAVTQKGWNLQTNGTSATSPVRLGDKVNLVDGVNTKVSPITASQNADGSYTNTFKIDVDAQSMVEAAQLPVVYTDADGKKVYKQADGHFNTAPDGSGTKIDAEYVIASMQDAAGSTSTATKLGNVAAGTVSADSTDAINGSQLYTVGQQVAGNTTALGGGATYDPVTNTYTAPSYTVTKTDGTTYGAANNVGAALKNLNAEVIKPLTITGNDFSGTTGGAGSLQPLGSTLKITGGALLTAGSYSGANVKTVVTDGQVAIQMADAPVFTGAVTAPTFVASGEKPVTINGNTGTIGGLTNTTFDPDNFTSGQAATEDQLAQVSEVAGNANQGFNIAANSDASGITTDNKNIKPGQTLTIQGTGSGDFAGYDSANIQTQVSADNTVTIGLTAR